MWSYDYEVKQESHAFQEKRSTWGTTYPSHNQKYYVPQPTTAKIVSNKPPFHYDFSDVKYYVPPPTTAKKFSDKPPFHYDSSNVKNYVPPLTPTTAKIFSNQPPFHYDSSDVEDDDDDGDPHYNQVPAVNNNRHVIHDHDHGHGNRGNWHGANHASNHSDVKNKHHGHGNNILRPPNHQYRYPGGVDNHRGKEASKTNTNYNNHTMGDYPKKHYPNYGEFSSLNDDEYDEYNSNEGRRGEEFHPYPSYMKGLIGGNRVKKIEVIEYERTTYQGARKEYMVLGGKNGANRYPNTNYATWVKGF